MKQQNSSPWWSSIVFEQVYSLRVSSCIEIINIGIINYRHNTYQKLPDYLPIGTFLVSIVSLCSAYGQRVDSWHFCLNQSTVSALSVLGTTLKDIRWRWSSSGALWSVRYRFVTIIPGFTMILSRSTCSSPMHSRCVLEYADCIPWRVLGTTLNCI